jgi:hypothetical protein
MAPKRDSQRWNLRDPGLRTEEPRLTTYSCAVLPTVLINARLASDIRCLCSWASARLGHGHGSASRKITAAPERASALESSAARQRLLCWVSANQINIDHCTLSRKAGKVRCWLRIVLTSTYRYIIIDHYFDYCRCTCTASSSTVTCTPCYSDFLCSRMTTCSYSCCSYYFLLVVIFRWVILIIHDSTRCVTSVLFYLFALYVLYEILTPHIHIIRDSRYTYIHSTRGHVWCY